MSTAKKAQINLPTFEIQVQFKIKFESGAKKIFVQKIFDAEEQILFARGLG